MEYIIPQYHPVDEVLFKPSKYNSFATNTSTSSFPMHNSHTWVSILKPHLISSQQYYILSCRLRSIQCEGSSMLLLRPISHQLFALEIWYRRLLPSQCCKCGCLPTIRFRKSKSFFEPLPLMMIRLQSIRA